MPPSEAKAKTVSMFGMGERDERFRLAREAFSGFRVLGEAIGEDFDGDVPVELDILRPIDFSHASRTKRRENPVRP